MNRRKDDLTDPLISVIIPVYNTEDYLEKTVASVLRQTFQKLEVILVDDGSPDRSGDICDMLAALDQRIRVIHTENRGISRARNVGMDAATGELIAFVDSDDLLVPVMYSVLLELMRRDPDVDIAECGFKTMYPDMTEKFTKSTGRVVTESALEAICSQMTWGTFKSVVWNKLYKKHVTEDIRFPPGKLHEDEFTTWKFFRNARRIAALDIDMHFYNRCRTDSLVSVKTDKRLDQIEASGELLDYVRTIGDRKHIDMVVREHCRRMNDEIPFCHQKGFHTERYYNAVRMAEEYYKTAKEKGDNIPPEYEAFFKGLHNLR